MLVIGRNIVFVKLRKFCKNAELIPKFKLKIIILLAYFR